MEILGRDSMARKSTHADLRAIESRPRVVIRGQAGVCSAHAFIIREEKIRINVEAAEALRSFRVVVISLAGKSGARGERNGGRMPGYPVNPFKHPLNVN